MFIEDLSVFENRVCLVYFVFGIWVLSAYLYDILGLSELVDDCLLLLLLLVVDIRL